MGRGTAIVVGISVMVAALFFLSCYLMTTVNPKPLDSVSKTPGVVGGGDGRKSFNVDLYPNDEVVFAGDEDEGLGYGLEKATGEEKNIFRPVSKILPLYRSLLRQGAFVNSSLISDVVPPIVPSQQRLSTSTQRPKFFEPFKKISNANSSLNILTANYPPAKGFRRSVNELETNLIKEEEEQNSGVILKIVDDSGRSRIEIKLGPNGSFDGHKLRRYRSSGSKAKADNSSHASDDISLHDSNVGAKNTIIKILPNNTMVFEEIDHSLVSLNVVKDKSLTDNEGINSNSSIIGNRSSTLDSEANVEEIVLLVKKSDDSKNVSSDVPAMNETGMYTLKMLIDDETKSINQIVPNIQRVNDTFDKKGGKLNYFDKINKTNFTKAAGFFYNLSRLQPHNETTTEKPLIFYKYKNVVQK